MAKLACGLLLKESKDKGNVINKEGKRCGKVAPEVYHGHNPELSFDKPEGFVVVS